MNDLQQRVYAADGDAAGDPVIAAAVHQLVAEIATETAAIVLSVRAAEAHAGGDTAPPSLAGADGHNDVGTGPNELLDPSAGPAADEPDGASARSTRRRVLLAAALAGALTVGGLLGHQLTVGGSVVAGTSAPSVAAPATEPPLIADLDFVAEQAAHDVPTVMVGATFKPESFRYLGSAGWSDDGALVGPSPFYAARGTADMLCLVAVPESGGSVSTCALESGFPPLGLRLSWEETRLLTNGDPADNPEWVSFVGDVTVSWARDGTVSNEWASR